MATHSRRHYIIVVHGIGDQKLNETTTPVVHRFAEALRASGNTKSCEVLLPAYLSAQSVRRRGKGHRWSEFRGIPVDGQAATPPFDGAPATDSGGFNYRFVDMYWAHILRRHQQKYSSSTEQWTKALQNRLQHAPDGWLPDWAGHLLGQLIETALPIQKLLSLANKDLATRIFRDFLGDVHLYGDYARTRGKAVRHFHVVLDEIHIRDFIQWYRYGREKGESVDDYRPPTYTIIAHSLGSIMSFDALVYSRARDSVRASSSPVAHDSPSLPFPGYRDEAKGEEKVRNEIISMLERKDSMGNDEIPDHPIKAEYLTLKGKKAPIPLLLWRDCIENFVTLGSPIDKYHVLWFQNYYHMGLKMRCKTQPSQWVQIPESCSSWSQGWLDKDTPPPEHINHYNLCDEQDPVGHHLDVAQATDNYSKIFNGTPVAERDVVFRRYSIPGVAHVEYWEDVELSKGIIKEVIEKDANSLGSFAKKSFWEKKRMIRSMKQNNSGHISGFRLSRQSSPSCCLYTG